MNYVVFFTLQYDTLEQAQAKAPDDIRAHVARTKEFHARGKLLLAVVFRDLKPPLCTMAVLTSRDAAEEFARGDPFVLKGMVEEWHIRECNDILG